MKLHLAAATAVALVGSALALAQDPTTKTAPAPAPTPGGSEFKDLKSKVSYGLGLNIGKGCKKQGIDLDTELLLKGLRDGLTGGKGLLTEEEFTQAMQTFMMESAKKQGEDNKRQGVAYLAENAKKPGVKTLPSGLQYKVEKEGAGASPKATDLVTVHYEGRLIDGTVFDSSAKTGQPANFQVNQVIAGWIEALQLMKVGAKWQLVIPAELAYKDRAGPLPPNSTLIFDVELISIGGGR